MSRELLLSLALPSVLVAVAACDTNTIIHEPAPATADTVEDTPAPPPDEPDAGTPKKDASAPVDDAGDDNAGLPAAVDGPQPLPPVTYHGGEVLGDITLVTITVDGDPMRTKLESFASTIGSSTWWDAVRAGYCDSTGQCVGRATPHPTKPTVHLPASAVAQTLKEEDVQTIITTNIKSGAIPAPTKNTYYDFYFPAGTTISGFEGVSCQDYGAFHDSMSYDGIDFAYGVLPRCPTGNGAAADFESMTISTSHELAEAATDPISSLTGYTAFGSDMDSTWDYPAYGEVGDRCNDLYYQGYENISVGSYTVQRIWNNVAAKAGHDPCLPAPSPSTTPFFTMTPVSATGFLMLAVGESSTLTFQAISDGAITHGLAWDITEVTKLTAKGDDVLTVSSSSNTISVGGTGTVTVTLKSKPTIDHAIALVRAQRLDSNNKPTGQLRYWPVVVFAK